MNKQHWFLLGNTELEAIRAAAAGTVTQGEMVLRASCARKWFYRYALQLEKRGMVDYNLIYGSLMHSLLEALYSSEEEAWASPPSELPVRVTDEMVEQATGHLTPAPRDYLELELVKDRVQIAFDAYRTHYHKSDSRLLIHSVEHVYEVEFEGVRLAGKLDMVAEPHRRGGIFVWDFKTAAKLDAMALDAWTFRFQFLFYCWLYWKATGKKPMGTMINGLLKSALRPKIVDKKTGRTENREEYLYRVKGDMAMRRERYFYRQRIPLITGALERFEEEILGPHLDAFRVLQSNPSFAQVKQAHSRWLLMDAINALAMQMNTNHCHVYNSYCEYLSLCKDGGLALGEFDKREAKHVELNL